MARMCSVSGRALSRKIAASGADEPAPHRAEGVEPGAEVDGVNRHEAPGPAFPGSRPVGISGS